MTLFSTNGRTGAGNTIGDLLKGRFGKKILKKDFTINRPQTLFGPSWANLKSNACIYCGNKLKTMRSGAKICSSTKHKKPFVISESKFNELVAKQTSGREIYIN